MKQVSSGDDDDAPDENRNDLREGMSGVAVPQASGLLVRRKRELDLLANVRNARTPVTMFVHGDAVDLDGSAREDARRGLDEQDQLLDELEQMIRAGGPEEGKR